jgi:PAS domain S-box-containing protein
MATSRSKNKTPVTRTRAIKSGAKVKRRVEERTRELTETISALEHEIAKGKNSLEATRQAEDRIRLVIDTIPIMAWSLLPNGSLDFVNRQWLDYTGVSMAEAVREPTSIVHPDDLPSVLETWAKQMAAGQACEDELRLRRADGEYRWFLVRTTPVFDESGRLIKWYGTSTDIEDRRRTENQWRVLIDAIPQQIWSAPPDGKTDYCNDRWRSYSGIELEDLRGYGWKAMIHPEDRDRVLDAWHAAVANGTPYEQEERHRGRDGKYRWFLSLALPLRDQEGRIVRWYGTNTDIDDRKRFERSFQALPAELLKAQDEERRRIARELHDSTAQELAVVAMNLGRLEEWIEGRDPWAENLLADSLAVLTQGNRELRTLAHLLHPPMLEELGLIGALRDYVEGFSARSGIEVELEFPDHLERCPEENRNGRFSGGAGEPVQRASPFRKQNRIDTTQAARRNA